MALEGEETLVENFTRDQSAANVYAVGGSKGAQASTAGAADASSSSLSEGREAHPRPATNGDAAGRDRGQGRQGSGDITAGMGPDSPGSGSGPRSRRSSKPRSSPAHPGRAMFFSPAQARSGAERGGATWGRRSSTNRTLPHTPEGNWVTPGGSIDDLAEQLEKKTGPTSSMSFIDRGKQRKAMGLLPSMSNLRKVLPLVDDFETRPGAAQANWRMTVHNLGHKTWKRDRNKVNRILYAVNASCALVGVCGAVVGISLNELVLGNEDPSSSRVEVLKTANLAITLVVLVLLVAIYYLEILITRLTAFFERGVKLHMHIHPFHVLRRSRFWLEVLVLAMHLPPGLTFEIPTYTGDNFIMYRAETLFAMLQTLRVYLLWRILRDHVLHQHPKRFAVAVFKSTPIGSLFVFKHLLQTWSSLSFLSTLWVLFILVSGYWYRCFEISACLLETAQHPTCSDDSAIFWRGPLGASFQKQNDLSYFNAVWVMFITSATVGYGDFYPSSYGGRVVAAMAAIMGLCLTSLLTASLSHTVEWTEEEHSAILILEREAQRVKMQVLAARLIQVWYRARKVTRPSTLATQFAEKEKLLRQLKEARAIAQVELDQLAGERQKIDQIAVRAKYTEHAVMDIASELGISGYKLPASAVFSQVPSTGSQASFQKSTRQSFFGARPQSLLGRVGKVESFAQQAVAELRENRQLFDLLQQQHAETMALLKRFGDRLDGASGTPMAAPGTGTPRAPGTGYPRGLFSNGRRASLDVGMVDRRDYESLAEKTRRDSLPENGPCTG